MAKKINGIMCNELGQPITMSNGYSSEDENEILDRRNPKEDENEIDQEQSFDEEIEYTDLQQDDEYEHIDGLTFKDGYLCNDQGTPINMENGYSSEDEENSINCYNAHKGHGYFNDEYERE